MNGEYLEMLAPKLKLQKLILFISERMLLKKYKKTAILLTRII